MDNVVHLETALSTGRFERVSLGRRGKRKVVEVLLPGLLLKGQSHLFYGASDTGKSWIAQYASRETMREGLPVLYMDLENLSDVMEERMLDTLEVSQDDLDDYFHYYPTVDLTLDAESKLWFTSLLDSFPEPGLIAWDSLLGFLTLAGMKEDSADDFNAWAMFYLDQARYRGWTSMVLDHTGHNGNHARGTSRKSQAVQVVHKVEKRKGGFDRTRIGGQKLTLEKDRNAYLPKRVETTLGGTPFVFSTGYDGQESLTDDETTALGLLPEEGARHKDWKELCTDAGMSGTKFAKALRSLKNRGHVSNDDGPYQKV